MNNDLQFLSDCLATGDIIMLKEELDSTDLDGTYVFFIWGMESDAFEGKTLAEAWHKFLAAHNIDELRKYVETRLKENKEKQNDA